MDCLSCGRPREFVEDEDGQWYWHCITCAVPMLATESDNSIMLNLRPNYRCVFDDGTLDIREDGEILYNDKPVESLDDAKKVMALLVKGIVSLAKN